MPSSEPALAGERFERFELARCVRCGTAVTMGAPPPQLHEVGAYRPGRPRLYRAAAPVLRLFDRQRLGMVRSLAEPHARLLDAGAGRGRFVLAAQRAGYDASGIDPATRETEPGAQVRSTSIEAAEIEAGSLDVVTLWHVLEHLEDPGAALNRIRSWLCAGGGLLVGVPNLDGLQAAVGGERWYHLDVPRHRVHFTMRGIQELLAAHGFEVVETRHVLLEHNVFGMWQSWLSRVTRHPSYVYNLLKRNAPARSPDLLVAVAAVPLAPVALLVELVAGLRGRGGTVAVLARRAE